MNVEASLFDRIYTNGGPEPTDRQALLKILEHTPVTRPGRVGAQLRLMIGAVLEGTVDYEASRGIDALCTTLDAHVDSNQYLERGGVDKPDLRYVGNSRMICIGHRFPEAPEGLPNIAFARTDFREIVLAVDPHESWRVKPVHIELGAHVVGQHMPYISLHFVTRASRNGWISLETETFDQTFTVRGRAQIASIHLQSPESGKKLIAQILAYAESVVNHL